MTTKDDDLSFLDCDEEEAEEDFLYLDYLDALDELKNERRRCARYVVPEDDYMEDL